MEDGDTEKYHATSVIQDFVFLSWKGGCIRCISLQVYNENPYHNPCDPNHPKRESLYHYVQSSLHLLLPA